MRQRPASHLLRACDDDPESRPDPTHWTWVNRYLNSNISTWAARIVCIVKHFPEVTFPYKAKTTCGKYILSKVSQTFLWCKRFHLACISSNSIYMYKISSNLKPSICTDMQIVYKHILLYPSSKQIAFILHKQNRRTLGSVRATLIARARNSANRGNPKINILKEQGYTNYPPNRGNPKIKV